MMNSVAFDFLLSRLLRRRYIPSLSNISQFLVCCNQVRYIQTDKTIEKFEDKKINAKITLLDNEKLDKIYKKCKETGNYSILYNTMEDYAKRSNHINVKVTNTFLKYLNKTNNFDGAISLLLILNARKIKLDEKHFGSVLSIALKLNKWKEAYRLFNSIEKFNIKKDKTIYDYMLQILSINKQEKYLYIVMKDIINKDNPFLYFINFIVYLNKSYLYYDSIQLFQYFLLKEIYHNDLIKIALFSCKELNNWLIALEFLYIYLSKNIKLSFSCYHSLFIILSDCNQYNICEQLYDMIINNISIDIIKDIINNEKSNIINQSNNIHEYNKENIESLIQEIEKKLKLININDQIIYQRNNIDNNKDNEINESNQHIIEKDIYELKNDILLHNLFLFITNKYNKYEKTKNIINYINNNIKEYINTDTINHMIIYYGNIKDYNQMIKIYFLLNELNLYHKYTIYINIFYYLFNDNIIINKEYINKIIINDQLLYCNSYINNYDNIIIHRDIHQLSHRLYSNGIQSKVINPFYTKDEWIYNYTNNSNYLYYYLYDHTIYMCIPAIDYLFNYLYINIINNNNYNIKSIRILYSNELKSFHKNSNDHLIMRDIIENHINNNILPINYLLILNKKSNDGWIEITKESIIRWVNALKQLKK